MPMRTFQSRDGTRWLVWSVVPGARHDAERRAGYDRRSPDPVIGYKGAERRVTPDRRSTAALISPQLRSGWLVFEAEGQQRRLAPIPPAWERQPEAALERLCSLAQRRPAN